MNAAQISKMTVDECFKAINAIEGKAGTHNPYLTATQKKQVAMLEKRINVLMPDCDD